MPDRMDFEIFTATIITHTHARAHDAAKTKVNAMGKKPHHRSTMMI